MGDPCENQIILDASVQILLIEGNVLLNEEPWCELPKVFSTHRGLSAALRRKLKRVVLRHMKADFTEEQALEEKTTRKLPLH